MFDPKANHYPVALLEALAPPVEQQLSLPSFLEYVPSIASQREQLPFTVLIAEEIHRQKPTYPLR